MLRAPAAHSEKAVVRQLLQQQPDANVTPPAGRLR